jgi:hypothetical protein
MKRRDLFQRLAGGLAALCSAKADPGTIEEQEKAANPMYRLTVEKDGTFKREKFVDGRWELASFTAEIVGESSAWARISRESSP